MNPNPNSERVDKLLIPRYKVCIWGYPDSLFFKPGQIIELSSNYGTGKGIPEHLKGVACTDWNLCKRSFTTEFFENYPNIFKRLGWWDYRQVIELPDYLRCIRTPDTAILPGHVLKVIEYNMLGASCDPVVSVPDGEAYYNYAWGRLVVDKKSKTVTFPGRPLCILENGCFMPALEAEYLHINNPRPFDE